MIDLEKQLLINPVVSSVDNNLLTPLEITSIDTNQERLTYLELFIKHVNQYISTILIYIDDFRANHILANSYIEILTRLHYETYILKDAWNKGSHEYIAYREYLKNIDILRFNIFRRADLLTLAIHQEYIVDELTNLYNIFDKLKELNKDVESLFQGEDSEIHINQ